MLIGKLSRSYVPSGGVTRCPAGRLNPAHFTDCAKLVAINFLGTSHKPIGEGWSATGPPDAPIIATAWPHGGRVSDENTGTRSPPDVQPYLRSVA
jgi:hypothetical protein